MTTIFSPTDVQDLVRLFQPTAVLNSSEHDGRTPPMSLLPSQSGKGFLVFTKVVQELERKLTEETKRIDVSTISQELDVSDVIVLRILKESPSQALFSRDKRHILPDSEVRRMRQQLLDSTSRRLVIKSALSHDKDLSPEGIDALVAGAGGGLLQLENPQSGSVHLTAVTYQSSVDNEIHTALQTSQTEAKSTRLLSEHFIGTPPLWYIFQRAEHMSTGDINLRGRVEMTESAVAYQPETYLVSMQDHTLEQLRAGAISHSSMEQFVELLPELYNDVSSVRTYFQTVLGDFGSFESKYAISQTWLEANRNNEVQKLVVDGYSYVASSIKENFPKELQAGILATETEGVISLIGEPPNATKVTAVKQYLIRDDYLQELTECILNASREQAKTQWARLEQDAGQECSLVDSGIFEEFSKGAKTQDDVTVLKAVFEKNEAQAKAVFAEQIATLESENETEFALFWSDRVLARLHVYRTSADAIVDPKLRGQLLELLQTHLVKELIPESLTRAQTRGLIRSKKTKKNTSKFTTAVRSASNLPAISSSLDKFAKKQGIDGPTPEVLAEKKSSQLKELIRGMKKDADGPRLFLTLVVVLLANRQAGIVYVTGKFAPKLMKLLKESMSGEEYEQLDKWKDAVKAGSLTAEDKAQMRALAAE
ncbi:uncharacterized protein BDZ99DRAFT_576574 [Mytilinidion resinicola]|uniref:Uncharacterized protein n=1 Tax=Mytilinidion resinicola TaxID=574789 RepID=A0A6A6Y2J7_9PEZI|nr:uncharacterized protein BDZ99DRAFT_576574 [Mytilinidion resinicola]KAF2803031.1 hypothetical protein BDZ99DRAFT_576574 [Mytilinidion resinicola]